MILRNALLVLATTVAIAGCAGGGAAPSLAASTGPSTQASQRIAVTLADSMTISMTSTAVKAGVPVTFVVSNNGTTAHEFYLGDEAAQAMHETEMSSGGMMHDEARGISVDPGKKKELIYTFSSPGTILAGCHISGHYPAGMKATITVSQ